MGTKDDNIKERMEMTKKNPAATQWKPPEHRKFQNEDVGVRKAPKLMFASQRYQKIFLPLMTPCQERTWKVASFCLDCGAA